MKHLFLCIVATSLLVGCVRESTHRSMRHALQQEIDVRDRDVADLNQKVEDQTNALAAKENRLALLAIALETSRGDRARIAEELATKNSEYFGLTEKLADILKDKAKLSASALELQNALRSLNERKSEADRRITQYRSLLGKFKKLIDAGTLQVNIVDGRMVLALPSDVLFGSGKAELSEQGRQAITEVASVLATIAGRRFQVEGHTDNMPIRTKRFASNWELASARALTVVAEMIRAGVAPGMVSGASHSEYRPVGDNHDDMGREKNRRIEIVLVPDLSMLPGFDDLKNIVGG